MRFGMPPQDTFNSQWMVRDLRGKSDKCFRAYVSLFMRHLCEPGSENEETFADGVPREGLSRQHVLSRIGIMSLIRKKVQEFEMVNGKHSMPHLADKFPPPISSSFLLKDSRNDSEATTPMTNMTPRSGTPASSARASPTPKEEDKKMETEKIENPEDANEEKKECKIEETNEKKEECSKREGSVEIVDESTSNENSKKESENENEEKKNEVIVSNENEEKKNEVIVSNEEEEKKNEEILTNEEEESQKVHKFMFNIADGGFTELHTLWQNEEKAATPGREYDIWHRRHDYWLLAG